MHIYSRTIALAALAAGVLLPPASAGTFDAMYAFGDSLSDVGNAFALTGIPAPPYANGQFSNGPVWLQTLASGLGFAPVTASLLGGTDYAYGGAETGNTLFHTENLSDLLGPTGQVAQFQMGHATADPNALYTIWIGSNDLDDIPSGATLTQIALDIGEIAANIDTAIGELALQGAKNFLVVTVPDLGKTPAAIAGGPSTVAAASAVSAEFDSVLVNGSGPIPSLASLASMDGLKLNVLDSYSLLDFLVANPSLFGFTDVTDPCLVGNTVCANPNQYVFWDALHPTAPAHAIIGAKALAVVVPEPGSITLVGAGLLGLVLVRRRAA